jgi:iron complex transport system ATP-binding protein
MIEARALSITRGARTVLRELTISLRPSEVLAVLGPNGSGKSTLLAALAGTLRPDRGGVWLDGRSLPSFSARALALRRAVLPQQLRLDFPLTALEVALLGRLPHLGPHGQESPRDLEIAEGALGRVDASHLAARPYPELSGGERQRVQLARALTQLHTADPETERYLLLDEPTASQDLAQQQIVLRLARSLSAEGVGVLVVLHDLNQAAQCADRIALLRSGELVACGEPSAVLTPSRIEGVFGVRVQQLRGPHPVLLPVPLSPLSAADPARSLVPSVHPNEVSHEPCRCPVHAPDGSQR